MVRKIRYKASPDSLTKMSAPNFAENIRASVGMEKFVGEFYYIDVEKLIPYKNQARVYFDDAELNNLADTIKEHGIRQPLTIIKSLDYPEKFEVISGERRLRAAKTIGLKKVPCIILETKEQAEEIALIENIQRQDLHPIELGRSLKKLIDSYGWGGQSELGKKLGIPQTRISEYLKMLNLSEEIQNLVINENYTGREKLLALLKVKSDEDKKNIVLGKEISLQSNENKSFSVIRLSYSFGGLKIQKNGMHFLSAEQRKEIKDSLQQIIKDLN